MADKGKIAELDKAIKNKRAELAKVQQEKAAAFNDPEKLVLAEKHERGIAGQLHTLEQAKAAAEYRPSEPTDWAELLKPLQRYYDEKAAKVCKVDESIQAAEREREAISHALQQAAEDCDTEKTIELSERRGELESRLKHLREMRERVNALPVFPDGAITQEWATICEKSMPDWEKAVLQVETLAAAYKAACASLLQKHDTLLSVRRELEGIAAKEGLSDRLQACLFTAGLRGKKLTVEKGDYIRLNGLDTPVSGGPAL